jgi:flap endonuclease-1
MGVQITELISGKEITLDELKNKTFAVDTYNLLYQFLSSIRQADGALLTDSKGRVTSHLAGLFNRVTKLMGHNMRFIFCFDGQIPELKKKELKRRKELKEEAQKKYDQAAEEVNIDDMKKYAARTTRLTPEMVEDAKKLIRALGQVIVEAPSEGEAQASYIVKKGDADYVLSQDADCLLFGAPAVIRNLTISGKRKRPGAFAYEEVLPFAFKLKDVLHELDVTNDQLIVLGMLVGTDYNIGGVKGIGPKKALSLVKKHRDDFEAVFEEAKWSEHFETPWKEIFDTIKHMPVKQDYELKWKNMDRNEVVKLLVEEYDFSKERTESTLDKLDQSDGKKQKGLGEFF